MIHTDEDDEFERIAHEAEMKRGQPYHFEKRKDDDDDIQDYVRPWVGLTDEERNKLWREVVGWGDPSHDDEDLMKAIEAKLKEKNT